jgi:4-hydroxy-3-methylbut-2-enyl diphosphate reductase
MQVLLASNMGFCFGVKRAIKLASQAAKADKSLVYTLGPLIHNPQVVEDLKRKGVEVVQDVDQMNSGTLIIRSHGAHPKILAKAKQRGLKIIDATCPFVRKAQENAEKLYNEGYQVIVVGEGNHPEVQGIVGYTQDQALVINHNLENSDFSKFQKVGVVAQTTLTLEVFEQVIKELLRKVKEVKICNTICDATTKIQKATLKTAEKVDLMIVVGGHNSANTSRLAKLCQNLGKKTFHIETEAELRPEWFRGKNRVGITAGSSTPDWIIKKVVEKIESLV